MSRALTGCSHLLKQALCSTKWLLWHGGLSVCSDRLHPQAVQNLYRHQILSTVTAQQGIPKQHSGSQQIATRHSLAQAGNAPNFDCSSLPGGGAVEAALSIYLENFANTLGSREQLAIAEFADALLVIPKTLAVNAAKDATELVAKLRAYHYTAQVSHAPAYLACLRMYAMSYKISAMCCFPECNVFPS